ncbi:MAG: hypothetical protein DI598_14700 [Pseudopedobacter saltans]|uniref:Signal transduction histidine kinase internal region domain-containing protein n=1 Tax=Pseudopedobacter saltans TaxID=151895 RepID=A0A2W5GF24_9SPHI|nr:MAG: hypothetical protein DI598_14700 [Pseudopedobacter saltans]
MKQNKIHIFLPIAIAALLPGINFLSHYTDWPIASYDSLLRWTWSSVVLYILWYVLLWTSKLRSKYKWLWVAAATLAIVAVVYALFSVMVFHIPQAVRYQLIIKVLFAAALQLIIQYSLRASDNIGRLRVEKEQAIAEMYKVQLQELRTRVDPHFLFNSLNTLRSMVHQKDPKSEPFILHLSQLYRQMLKLKEQATVTLRDEMEVVNAYVFLMQQRSGTGLQFSQNINDAYWNDLVPTMSVQTIVENCFKHNRTGVSEPLHIEITADANHEIIIRNNLLPKISVVEKSGYGIQNIRKSYALLKIAEGIYFEETDRQFEVKLKLISDERINHRG